MTIEIDDVSHLDLTRYIRPGDLVAWGQACAEPLTLTEALAAQRRQLGRVRCFAGISGPAGVPPEGCDHLSFSAYTATGAGRPLTAGGMLAIVPAHYSQLPRILTAGPLRADVVFLSLPPAAPDGTFGPGFAADYIAELTETARVVLAEANDQVPDISSDVRIRDRDVDVLVHTSRPPARYAAAPARDVEEAIAGHVANLIPDGATLQLGIGSMPSAVTRRLLDHRDLGVHSGMITDAVADLIDAGVVTGARKSLDRGKVVTGFLMGSDPLLKLAATEPSISVRSTSYTHDPAVLAAQQLFVAINSATEGDLYGAANSETAAGKYVGAIGGIADFARGAARSRGGIPIIALPSTAVTKAGEKVSRIVARLSGPASLSRADAGVIVTEYGVADLRGLALPARRERMLAIAHPDFRNELAASSEASAP